MIVKTLTAAVLTALAVSTAGPANADTADYLDFLDSNGVDYAGATTAVVQLGKNICGHLRDGADPELVFHAVEDRGFSGEETGYLMVGAASFLCSDQYAALKRWATTPQAPKGNIV